MTQTLLMLFTADIRELVPAVQEQIYREFYRLVYPTVYYIVKDHAATEDIVQEAFMRAVAKKPKEIDEAKIAAWLKTVARSVTFNYLRKMKRRRDELLPESVFINELESRSFGSPAPSVHEEVEAGLMREAIEKTIRGMKPEYRLIVHMRWQEQLSYKEIAEQLRVTEGVVRQKLYRARDAIRKQLEAEWGDVYDGNR